MWLEVMRVAHQMGILSSATMMYGTTDTIEDRILHLLKLRDLQDETGGFTAFFCWDFQHEQGTRIQAIDFDGDGWTDLFVRRGDSLGDDFGPVPDCCAKKNCAMGISCVRHVFTPSLVWVVTVKSMFSPVSLDLAVKI